jgi:hypothetical protein
MLWRVMWYVCLGCVFFPLAHGGAYHIDVFADHAMKQGALAGSFSLLAAVGGAASSQACCRST